ncbi:hypothetical protein SBA1_800016 [Candidatus Sulfotelmatobacter kueseliae]|uniref:Uncharacterized protein n=1 Tax=Candidatus Sulfotelmatobacter kueseliae TaxID=2042962 RepID=A0A2U3L855_9BACT|nr:hypothetical protein SBA1_800016 [Candidatus Sulfotelmatobacter kueseliae]
MCGPTHRGRLPTEMGHRHLRKVFFFKQIAFGSHPAPVLSARQTQGGGDAANAETAGEGDEASAAISASSTHAGGDSAIAAVGIRADGEWRL